MPIQFCPGCCCSNGDTRIQLYMLNPLDVNSFNTTNDINNCIYTGLTDGSLQLMISKLCEGGNVILQLPFDKWDDYSSLGAGALDFMASILCADNSYNARGRATRSYMHTLDNPEYLTQINLNPYVISKTINDIAIINFYDRIKQNCSRRIRNGQKRSYYGIWGQRLEEHSGYAQYYGPYSAYGLFSPEGYLAYWDIGGESKNTYINSLNYGMSCESYYYNSSQQDDIDIRCLVYADYDLFSDKINNTNLPESPESLLKKVINSPKQWSKQTFNKTDWFGYWSLYNTALLSLEEFDKNIFNKQYAIMNSENTNDSTVSSSTLSPTGSLNYETMLNYSYENYKVMHEEYNWYSFLYNSARMKTTRYPRNYNYTKHNKNIWSYNRYLKGIPTSGVSGPQKFYLHYTEYPVTYDKSYETRTIERDYYFELNRDGSIIIPDSLQEYFKNGVNLLMPQPRWLSLQLVQKGGGAGLFNIQSMPFYSYAGKDRGVRIDIDKYEKERDAIRELLYNKWREANPDIAVYELDYTYKYNSGNKKPIAFQHSRIYVDDPCNRYYARRDKNCNLIGNNMYGGIEYKLMHNVSTDLVLNAQNTTNRSTTIIPNTTLINIPIQDTIISMYIENKNVNRKNIIQNISPVTNCVAMFPYTITEQHGRTKNGRYMFGREVAIPGYLYVNIENVDEYNKAIEALNDEESTDEDLQAANDALIDNYSETSLTEWKEATENDKNSESYVDSDVDEDDEEYTIYTKANDKARIESDFKKLDKEARITITESGVDIVQKQYMDNSIGNRYAVYKRDKTKMVLNEGNEAQLSLVPCDYSTEKMCAPLVSRIDNGLDAENIAPSNTLSYTNDMSVLLTHNFNCDGYYPQQRIKPTLLCLEQTINDIAPPSITYEHNECEPYVEVTETITPITITLTLQGEACSCEKQGDDWDHSLYRHLPGYHFHYKYLTYGYDEKNKDNTSAFRKEFHKTLYTYQTRIIVPINSIKDKNKYDNYTQEDSERVNFWNYYHGNQKYLYNGFSINLKDTIIDKIDNENIEEKNVDDLNIISYGFGPTNSSKDNKDITLFSNSYIFESDKDRTNRRNIPINTGYDVDNYDDNYRASYRDKVNLTQNTFTAVHTITLDPKANKAEDINSKKISLSNLYWNATKNHKKSIYKNKFTRRSQPYLHVPTTQDLYITLLSCSKNISIDNETGEITKSRVKIFSSLNNTYLAKYLLNPIFQSFLECPWYYYEYKWSYGYYLRFYTSSYRKTREDTIKNDTNNYSDKYKSYFSEQEYKDILKWLNTNATNYSAGFESDNTSHKYLYLYKEVKREKEKTSICYSSNPKQTKKYKSQFSNYTESYTNTDRYKINTSCNLHDKTYDVRYNFPEHTENYTTLPDAQVQQYNNTTLNVQLGPSTDYFNVGWLGHKNVCTDETDTVSSAPYFALYGNTTMTAGFSFQQMSFNSIKDIKQLTDSWPYPHEDSENNELYTYNPDLEDAKKYDNSTEELIYKVIDYFSGCGYDLNKIALPAVFVENYRAVYDKNNKFKYLNNFNNSMFTSKHNTWYGKNDLYHWNYYDYLDHYISYFGFYDSRSSDGYYITPYYQSIISKIKQLLFSAFLDIPYQFNSEYAGQKFQIMGYKVSDEDYKQIEETIKTLTENGYIGFPAFRGQEEYNRSWRQQHGYDTYRDHTYMYDSPIPTGKIIKAESGLYELDYEKNEDGSYVRSKHVYSPVHCKYAYQLKTKADKKTAKLILDPNPNLTENLQGDGRAIIICKCPDRKWGELPTEDTATLLTDVIRDKKGDPADTRLLVDCVVCNKIDCSYFMPDDEEYKRPSV